VAVDTAALDWPQAIDRACTRAGFVRTVFQPIVDVGRGVVTGYEALSRFAGPPDATPDVWFGHAASLGRADELEARTLAAALASRGALPTNCFLTVNVSPPALLGPRVQAVFAGQGDLRGVVVEVTEQERVDDYDALHAALAPLRAAGAHVAVDDAGAGFASLQHIVRLRPEFVKIDRELVAGIDVDETKAAVVETLGIFASRVDAWVIAEGVETERELERLAGLKVPLAQGYLLGRPKPAMEASSRELARAQAQAERVSSAGPLDELAESAPALAAAATPAQVMDAFLLDQTATHLVLLDDHRRPWAMVDRDGARLGAAPLRGPLAVSAEAALPDVAERAMTRRADRRFDPLVLCDQRGRYRGIVRVERLMQSLARAARAA
jgi:EAL domain-containing protein (putative c-di-GMP-specific phosphodiesterase class I)